MKRTVGVLTFLVVMTFGGGNASALEHRLIASDGAAFDAGGNGVAVEGDTVAVGAPAATDSRGAVYVFARLGDTWVQTGKLTASDAADGDDLGWSVAIDGDTIVAGAIDANGAKGAVYTFPRTGAATRTETAKYTASDAATGDGLGFSVAIDGDKIVAGAQGDDNAKGAVYMFPRTGTNPDIEDAKYTASDAVNNDRLGFSVAIDGDTVVGGAFGSSTGKGAVYRFPRSGTNPDTEDAKLVASDGATGDNLGFSVAIGGDTIVGGAKGKDSQKGALYTFPRTGASPVNESAKLTTSDAANNDRLGFSVAIDGETIVAGARGEHLNRGTVYGFSRTGANPRTEISKFAPADAADGDGTGVSISASGGLIAVGSERDNVGENQQQGSATVFYSATVRPPVITPPAVVKPAVSGFKLSAKSVKAGKNATFRFTLAAAATVKIKLERQVAGQRRSGKCRAPKKGSKGKKCKRYVSAKTLTARGVAGANRVTLRTKGMKAGTYRATLTATNSAGKTTAKASFKITAAKKKKKK